MNINDKVIFIKPCWCGCVRGGHIGLWMGTSDDMPSPSSRIQINNKGMVISYEDKMFMGLKEFFNEDKV